MTENLLPDKPYIGLAQYDASQSPLFAGRDAHVAKCARSIARADTKIFLLHGQVGCGKSSFLRAGLIPELEARCVDHIFLRRRTEDPKALGKPVFIRCGKDPLENLARELYLYVSLPVTLMTAEENEEPFDLSSAKLGCTSVEEFIRKCANPDLLLEAFAELSKSMGHVLVIVLDQMEEVLTLNAPESGNRARFFRFLKLFNVTRPRAKLILSLRKDHSGEFIGLAQLNNTAAAEFKVYLLPEMTPPEVLSAILLPTSTEDVKGAGIPREKYKFHFDEGVAEDLVRQLFDPNASGGTLSVMQIVCRDLYEAVTRRREPWIIDAKLLDDTSVEDCIISHISKSLREQLRGLDLPEAVANKEERRWRKILYELVKNEGDGRVYTNLISLSRFRTRAREVGAIADANAMFDYLTRTDVLVLRRVSVKGANVKEEEALCGLGHDVIGVALQKMKFGDDALEEAEDSRARLFRRAAISAGGFVLLLAGAAGWNWFLSQNDLARSGVRSRFDDIKANYTANIASARSAALAVARNAADMFDADTERAANTFVQRLQSHLPNRVTTLPSPSQTTGRVVHALLESPPGFVSLFSDGTVSVRRFNKGAASMDEVQFKLAEDFELPADAFISASEPTQNKFLILVSSYAAFGTKQAFRLWILDGKTGKAMGPFSGDDLLRKFNVFTFRNAQTRIANLDALKVSAVALAADVITLTAADNARQFVMSLKVNRLPKNDYFVPAMDVAVELPTTQPTTVYTPRSLQTMIIGGQLFTVQYPEATRPVAVDLPKFEQMSARSLGSDDHDRTSGDGTWALKVDEIQKATNCGGANREQCLVSFVPNRGPLQLVRLSSFDSSSNVDKTLAQRSATKTSYVVIEPKSGKYRIVNSDAIADARAKCELVEPVEDGNPANGAAAPTFVTGRMDDILFAYTAQQAVQLVRVRDGQFHCVERLSDEVVFDWRFLPEQNLLTGLSATQMMFWDLGKDGASAPIQQASTETSASN